MTGIHFCLSPKRQLSENVHRLYFPSAHLHVFIITFFLSFVKYFSKKIIVKATPHKECTSDTKSNFSSDCIEISQAY